MSDFVGPAVNGIQDHAVYIAPDAELSDASSIETSLAATSTAVVVLPADADDIVDRIDLASQIQQKSGDYSTVIVVIDDAQDTFGVAGKGASDILTALNTHAGAGGGAAIEAAMPQIVSLTGSDAEPGSAAVGIVLGGLGLAAAAVVAVIAVAIRRATSGPATGAAFENVPTELKVQLEKLSMIQRQHQSAGQQAMAPQISDILSNCRELFRRIQKKGTSQQALLAGTEYVDTLGKLNRALGSDYFLDILAHRDLWDDPDDRLQRVRDAVAATQAQLLKNIRQVNASQDLEFQVALESLLGTMDSPTIDSVYSAPAEDAETKETQGDHHE